MKRFLLSILTVSLTFFHTDSISQTVTKPANIASSVSIDGGADYASSLPTVSFSTSDFSAGCIINDVQVAITWSKTRGGCGATAGLAGNNAFGEMSFRLDGPTGQEVLVRPNYYGGSGNMESAITTTFDQDFPGLPTVPNGTPQAGSFRPTNGNLNNFDGDPVAGTWALRAGDNNGGGDPLCVSSYSITLTTSPDNTQPTWNNGTLPSNQTLNAASGQCGAVATWSTPTANDACGIASVNRIAGPASGSTFPVGITTVTYRATDNYGNTRDYSFTVNVVDNQPPTANCPSNIEQNATPGDCFRNITFSATASDNCSGATIALLPGSLPSGSDFPVGVSTVSYRATDASGNTNDCSFTVTVLDVEDPEITCPSNISVTSTLANCGAPVTYTPPIGTDNCTPTTFIATPGFESGANFPSGTTTVQYVVTDGAGNSADCEFDVTVDPIPNGELDITAFPVCQGDSTPITFTFTSGAGPFNVVITDGLNQFAVNGVNSGDTYNVAPPTNVTYEYLEIQDASGCTRTSDFDGDASITVIAVPDIVTTELDENYCEDEPAVSLSANPANGFWFLSDGAGGFLPGAGLINLGGGNAQFNPGGAAIGQNIVAYAITVPGSFCVDTAYQTVNVDELPTPDAGTGGSECDLEFTFSAIPSLGTGTWTLVSGTGTAFFSDVNAANASVQVTATGTYVFRWTEVNGECSAFDEVTVVFNEVPVADAGLGGSECDLDFVFNATPSVGTGTWTSSGPGNASFAPSANDPNATVTVDATGVYDFTWTEDNAGCIDSESIEVDFVDVPVADAGSDGSECDLDFVFSAVPSVGTGTWTLESGPGTTLFSNVNDPLATVQVSVIGTYVFRWTEVNSVCSDFDEVTVVFNEVPVANAGFPGAECDLDFPLNAVPSVGSGTWTASGPGSATYSPSANDASTTATVDAYGAYTFTWTEDNNGCTDSDDIQVIFDELPVANAGTGGDQCDLDFTFNGTASVGTGTWTFTGPGGATFTDANSPTTDVTVTNYGTYEFTWTEVNGNCSSVDQVTVNFFEQPVADAGLSADQCDLDFEFAAMPSAGNGVWIQQNGPGSSTFADDTDPATTVTVDAYGTYSYTWTETNGTCTDSENLVVNYYEQPTADAGQGGDECDLSFLLQGVATAGNGLWTATGPGLVTFDDDINDTTLVTVDTYGTYEFTWTELSGTCEDDASVTVNFYEQPVAVAGPGGDVCDLDFLLQASPSVGTGVWTQNLGPGTASFSNASSPTTLVTVDVYGTYEFTWTETNGTCVDSRNTTVNFFEQPLADAGVGGEECDLDFDLSAVPSVGDGLWTSAGPGTATFTDDTDPNATVTVSQSGSYTFTWTETNGTCSDDASVSVDFFDQPVADAGAGGDECDLNFTFTGVSSFGTGTWTFTGPGSAFISDANSPTATISVDAYGSYEFTWTEVNGTCSDDASITVNFYEQPVANAGTVVDQCDLDYTFTGTASVGTGEWTFVGPGNVLASPSLNDVNATVTVDASGSYDFTWTEDNNGCVDSDDITVVFNSLPVVSFSGLDATYCIDQTTPVPLTGSPSGGTFSGLGISGNSFVPSVAGLGTIFITYTYTDSNGCTNSETQSVDVNGLPTVSFSGLDTEYCEDDAIPYTLLGSPAGGTFSGAGIVGDDFIPSDAGSGTWTINYTYTDPFGCTNVDEQDVLINELPVVSFTGLSPAYCEDASSASLTGSPVGGSFSGDGIIGNQFSPAAAGVGVHTVTYTYTDGNGCTNFIAQDVTVNELPLPVITPSGTTEICDGDDLLLDAGAGYSVYNWSNSTNGQTTTVNSGGTYNVVVVTAEGCAGTSAPVQVVVNDLPIVDLGNDTTICTASVLTLDAGNAGASYSWDPTTEITQTIDVTTTGVYIAEVTDANGCVGSDAVSVTVADLLDPVIVGNGPLTFCSGDSVTLDAGSFVGYEWNTGAQSQTITVSTSGIYEVTVTDQFGCEGSDEETVAVLQLPNAVITPAGPLSLCEGDTATLSATNNFAAYSWNPGSQQTSSIDVFETGSYEVTVTDPNNGCQSTAEPVEVVVNSITTPSIVPSGDTEFCQGGSVSLSVEPGPYNSVLWTSGSTTPSIVVTQSGEYGVTVIDANGCVDSTLTGDPLVITVWNPQPVAVQSGDTVEVVNPTFVNYQWYYNGSPIPGATGPTHLPAENGIYYVEVTDENDCLAESNFVEFTATSIAETEFFTRLEMYPNPTDGELTVEFNLDRKLDVTIELFDVTGKQVQNAEVFRNIEELRHMYDFSGVQSGIYFLRLTTDRGSIVKQVVRR